MNKVEFFAEAPIGDGLRPPNAIFEAVRHRYGESIIWRIDANGWPIGYELTTYKTDSRP